MIFRVTVSFLVAMLLTSFASAQQEGPFDPLQALLQGQDSDVIFEQAIGAQIGVPPDYADVVFWHNESGEPIPYSEIRNLMGPVRQDGVIEALLFAESLLGDQLPLDVSRLARLMDASYLASMRHPPEHIAVEVYDTRTGPTGDLTGGVSGHTPLNQNPPASAEERIDQLRRGQ